jgi:RHS repeat-associated protein
MIDVDTSETLYYYHRNNNFNVVAITDSSGNVVERYTYTAYGLPLILTGAGTDSTWGTADDVTASYSSIDNPYTFTGRRLDEETGLMYYYARYYSTPLGRFITRDPLGYVDGYSLYEYCTGKPFVFIDPLGLKGYVVIYYTKPAEKAFERAGDTFISNIKSGKKWDENCDYVIKKGVLTRQDFINAWAQIDADVKKRLKNPKKYKKEAPVNPEEPDGPKKEVECKCDERLAVMGLFLHSSKDGNEPGLEFTPVPGDNDSTVGKAEISKLEILDWHPEDGEIQMHACNSGLPTMTAGVKGPSIAEMFRDRQNVKTTGEAGVAYFSEKEGEYDRINDKSKKVYLNAYERSDNVRWWQWGSGDRINPKVFPAKK